MRLLFALAVLATQAFAQPSVDQSLSGYINLADDQITSLNQAVGDFTKYVISQQTRLLELYAAISDARASDSPDPSNLGRLYIEYENILRDAVAHAATWRATAAKILTADQSALLADLRQADRLGNTAFLAWNANLLGTYLTGPSGSAFGTSPIYGLPPLYSDVQSYLLLSDAQVDAINALLSDYGASATLLTYQVKQANANTQLELAKDSPDAFAVGTLISGMDSLVKQPDNLPQLRTQLLAILTDVQRQRLRNLESAYSLSPVATSGICAGLIAPANPPLTLSPNGAVLFDVNNPPVLNFGCPR